MLQITSVRCTPLGLSIRGVEDQVPLPLGARSRKSVRSPELNDACGYYNSTFAKNKYGPVHISVTMFASLSKTNSDRLRFIRILKQAYLVLNPHLASYWLCDVGQAI